MLEKHWHYEDGERVIQFTIPGAAQAQERTGRFINPKDGRIVSYDPRKSRDYKTLVQWVAMEHSPKLLLDGPLFVKIDVFKPMPKSLSKKKRIDAIAGRLRPITKPDNTNYAKGIEDALNGLIWHDDSQIVTITIRKWYGEMPRTVVRIEQLNVIEELPKEEL